MGRVFSLLLVFLTIFINVFALTGLFYALAVEQTAWRQPFWGLGQIYAGIADQSFSVVSQFVHNRVGFKLPEWSVHLFVLYASSAFAIGASGLGVARRESAGERAASAFLSAAWPLAIALYTWKAIRLRLVTNFARDHSLILVIYILVTIGVYVGARYINANVLSGEPVSSADFTNYEVEQAQLGMPIVLLRDPRKEGRRVAILTDDWLYCYPPDSKLYRVPRGYLTDFASIPAAARAIFNPFGDHAEAAVIHDWLYAVGEEGERPHADEVFRFAMKEQGVNIASRRIMHRAVRMGGKAAYGANREWTFYDPITFEPMVPPFDKPDVAAVDNIDCKKFDAQYFELKEKYSTQRDTTIGQEVALNKIEWAPQNDATSPLILAQASQPLYGPEQFGKINLEHKQSSSSTVERLEAILGDRAKFEPLVTYAATSKLRRLSSAIGRLDIRHPGATETCTASIISSQYILTNYHCVPGTGKFGPATAAQLVMGYYNVADTSAVKRYSVSTTPVEADKSLDYAVLSVSGDPAKDFGVIRILDEDPAAGASLIVFHHPLGRPKHVTRAGCQVASDFTASGDQIFHSCDTLPGSSGAPVFAEFGRGVLGLHYAGPGSLGPGQYNFAKRMKRILSVSRILTSEPATESLVAPPRSQAEFAVTPLSEIRFALEDFTKVRDLPSGEAKEIGQFEKSERVKVTGKVDGENWYRVQLSDGREGYVSGIRIGVKSPDHDTRPLVRIPPRNDENCTPQFGETVVVTIEFDVNPEGTTENISIVDSTSTNLCFSRAAYQAVTRWKYQPKVISNKTRWRRGVVTRIAFQG